MSRPWRLPEIRILETELATGDRIGQIARRLAPRLDRTEGAIRTQALALRARRGEAPRITRRRWTAGELARLRQAAAKLWIERGEG